MYYNNVIKTLEKALTEVHAPVGKHWACGFLTTQTIKSTLDLIQHQKAEIEGYVQDIRNKTTEAYIAGYKKGTKEFAERLCEGRVSNDPVVIAVKVELAEMESERE